MHLYARDMNFNRKCVKKKYIVCFEKVINFSCPNFL